MAPVSKETLDAFGKAVIHEVYDSSCQYLFDVISHGMKGTRPDPLHLAYKSLDPEAAAVLRQFLTEAVDQTFAQFLAFFDTHKIAILFPSENGVEKDVTATSDGLAAEPYSEVGWIARFSRFPNGIPHPECFAVIRFGPLR